MSMVKKYVYKCTKCSAKCQMSVKSKPESMCDHCNSTSYKYVGAYVECGVPAGECPVLGRTAFVTEEEPFDA